MDHITIEAHDRSVTGNSVKALRRKGLLPANLYGHHVPSHALQLDANMFSRLRPHLSPSSLVGLRIDGGAERLVMIHRIQPDVMTGRAQHIEFFQVNMTERLVASVPLVLTGFSSDVQKNEGLVLLQPLHALDVTCLPGNLPPAIDVPGEKLLEAGDAIYVRDLVIDRSKIELRTAEDTMIVSLVASQHAPEDEEPVTAEAEGAVAGGVETPDES